MAGPPEAARKAVADISEALLDRVDDLATDLSGVIRGAEPFYDAGGVVPAADLRASVRANLVHILRQLAGRPQRGPVPSLATGRRRAEQGVPLPVVLHSYRVAGRFIWAAIVAEATRTPDAAEALLYAGSQLWLIIDEHSGAITDSYRDTVIEAVRRNEQTRSAMLDVLLRGDPDDGSRRWECAASLGLPPQGTFVVVAAGAPRPGVESIPNVENALRVKGVRSAWRVEVGLHVGVVVLTPRTGIDRLSATLARLSNGPIGLSEPYPNLEHTPTALREARLACAAATGPEPVRYGAAPVAVLLASAPDAAAAVAEAILGPVLALSAGESDILLSTLRTWFAEHGATSTAAAALHVHRNTVRYRLRRIEELTGRSLTQPGGVAALHLALEACRVLRLPSRP
ncbi:PucR family transcriptional regulator [Virgisporangium aurantiacum]|uniref:PucR C-terminal helix-turn-helix domain-containing protein n=1 Tax=Virgisporangium aurantiacum TaxID=175570 RepID=A0A8J3Z0U2_9ACTN|nr:helix-turn-helix domain-containing protein [Virgisporangium aurantiacum]GIJ54392.1 hypothetical protein Vau01_019080 [Virgisporangium aurantiacum]